MREILDFKYGAKHASRGDVAFARLLHAGGHQVDPHVERYDTRAVLFDVPSFAAWHIQHLAIVWHVSLDEVCLDIVVESVGWLECCASGVLYGVVFFD